MKNVTKLNTNHITDALIAILNESLDTTWKGKFVGMATDGASVMRGKNNGVVAKIKDYLKNPKLWQSLHTRKRVKGAYLL